MILRMAWRNLGRHRARTALTVLAMALVIALSMFMSSMLSGMSSNLSEAVVDRAIGHVHLNQADYPDSASPYDAVPEASQLLEGLSARPDVQAVCGRVRAFGLHSKDTGRTLAGDASVGGILGTNLAREAALSGLDERLEAGRYLPETGEVSALVGARLAEDLGLELDDTLLVVTQALDGSIGQGVYGVRGIYRTGMDELDESIVLELGEAQQLMALEDQVHEVVVVTTGGRDTIASFMADAQERWPELSTRPWWEIRPDVVEMMAMSDGVNGLFALIVLVVAAFGVINTLLMSVYERTRELGVMRAVGMRPRRVVELVLAEALLLALAAAVLGLALGGLSELYLLTVGIDLAVNGQGEGMQLSGVTLDPVIRGGLELEHLVVPTVTLFAVTALGALWPAWRAARLDPVNAMRQD